MNIKKKITNSVTIGGWMQTSSLDNAEIISKSNFDWISIDLEHGNISNEKLKNMIRVIQGNKKLVFVRMPSSDPLIVGNILDCGVDGLIIPHIKNDQEVKKIIDKAFYPPLKNRGIGFSKANDFGANLKKNFKKNKNLLIIAMIENKEGLNNLNKILNVKYLDGIFIGPYDLSASYNITGKFKSKKFQNIIKQIKKVADKNKIACGMHVVRPDKKELEGLIKKKFKFLAYTMDSVIIQNYYQYPI